MLPSEDKNGTYYITYYLVNTTTTNSVDSYSHYEQVCYSVDLFEFCLCLRCFFGDWACDAGCKVLGQSTGTCDDEDKCWPTLRSAADPQIKCVVRPRFLW